MCGNPAYAAAWSWQTIDTELPDILIGGKHDFG